ncbi:hypothetical protein ASG40_04295 [Methylobacterium sp. Leaf399]|uniref:hypothetical protein n=1 Tax=Methylobacterium sp. Leaf399 TaxID=1736364 RepID=UPI0006F4813D|nr:hypothetical protein [Methylobacterium sp. Leaf399]KQT20021.1 hypothetical protein ASG40_04295 [Methylobacterium sp. Leaf399]
MTSLAEPAAQAARRVGGEIWPITDHVVVCRYPVSTSLPIPLAVLAPGGLDLVTWTFAGMGEAGSGGQAPVALLVLAGPDAATALREAGELALATHFHDLAIAVPRSGTAQALTAVEREALCVAVLSAIVPETVGPLSKLLPMLRPVIDALPVPETAPELTVSGEGASTVTLAGFSVPNYLLLRGDGDLSCARVASARVRPGGDVRTDLTLDTVWGRPCGTRPDRAILLTEAGFSTARIVAAPAPR